MFRKITAAFIFGLILPLLIVSVASAITIQVDGNREPAWDGTPAQALDPNEADIDDRYDISEINWTNNSLGSAPWGNLYLLVTTYANLDVNYPPISPQIIICIDTDNSTVTGATITGYCNNMSGVDRKVTVNLVALSVLIQSWTGTTWATVAQPAGGMRAVAWQDTNPADGIADLPYIEMGFDLQSLGIINTATCLSAMPTSVYYDNGMSNPEDQVPNGGTFNLGCGPTTAVTLNSLHAQPTTSPILPVALVGVSAVALIGIVFLIRRKKTA
jgi:hypothetical protein